MAVLMDPFAFSDHPPCWMDRKRTIEPPGASFCKRFVITQEKQFRPEPRHKKTPVRFGGLGFFVFGIVGRANNSGCQIN